MQVWLTRTDLKRLIGDFPESFDIAAKLDAFINNNEQGWLKQLIGSSMIAELKVILSDPIQAPTATQAEYIGEVKPFLAFAAWSDYIGSGGVQITKSGLVNKIASNEAQPIGEEDKSRLIRIYSGYAKQYALNLATLHNKYRVKSTCSPEFGAGNGKPTASVIKAENRSRWGNF